MKSEINIQFEINTIKEGDYFSCHIPKYDIYFSTKDENEIEKKGKILMNSFINYLVENN
jgi:hypothetical protein